MNRTSAKSLRGKHAVVLHSRSLLHPALPPPRSLRSGIGACYDKTTAVMTRVDDLKPDPYNTPQVHTMYTPINKLLMQGVVDSWIRLSASLAV